MGALYKTASPETVDFMYQLPQEQLIAAMKVNEQNIDTQYQQFAVLKDQLLKLRSLAADQPEVKKYLDEMEEKVTSLTKTLQNDPMAWKKQMPLVRDLGQQIQKDFTRGKAAHWQAQLDSFQAADAKEKARVGLAADKGGITPEQYEAWKSYTLNNFKGSNFDDATGTGQSIGIENLYANQDWNALLLKYSNDIKESSKKQVWDTIKGGYITKYEVNGEYVTEDQIDQLAINTMMADQNVMGQLKQGHKMGYMKGVFDANGQFINPIEYVDQIDPKTQKPTGNKVSRLNYNSPLAPAIAALRAREVYSKTGNEATRTADDFAKIAATGEETRKTDKAKYDLEHPQNNISPLTFEMGEQIMNPEDFTYKKLKAITQKYANKDLDDMTTAEITEERNAQSAIEAIEKAVKTAYKLSDSDYNVLSPYLDALSGQATTPVYKDFVSGNYDKEVWAGMDSHGAVHTDSYLKAKKLYDKLNIKSGDLAKTIATTNATKIPYFAINNGATASESDKILHDTGIDLAKSANDIGFFDPKKNSEWGKLDLRFDTSGGFYDKNGAWFDNDEKAITTPADMAEYLIPIASTPKGGAYTVIYKIDQAKLAADGRSIESGSGNVPQTIKIDYNKTNANERVRSVMKNASPSARKVLDRDNEPAMWVVANTGSQLKDLNNKVIPKVFKLLPGSDRYMVTIKENNSEKIAYQIWDRELNEFKTVETYAQKTPYGLVPPSMDVLNSKLIDAQEKLTKIQLEEDEKKNIDE